MHSQLPRFLVDNFANLCTRYVTPWPWPLTSSPWTFTALRDCHAFKLRRAYKTWAKSNNPWLSYRRFSAFSREILGGGSELTELSPPIPSPQVYRHNIFRGHGDAGQSAERHRYRVTLRGKYMLSLGTQTPAPNPAPQHISNPCPFTSSWG